MIHFEKAKADIETDAIKINICFNCLKNDQKYNGFYKLTERLRQNYLKECLSDENFDENFHCYIYVPLYEKIKNTLDHHPKKEDPKFMKAIGYLIHNMELKILNSNGSLANRC